MNEQDQGADRALESPSDAKVTKSIVGAGVAVALLLRLFRR
jgi:hypothetical protein